jgi:hypothetical protein
MENEIHKYLVGNIKLLLPRQWVPIEELKEIAVGIDFPEHDNLSNILQEQGIDVKGDKADFTGVNISLLEKGIISSEFLKIIIESNFSEEFVEVNKLIQLFKNTNFEKPSNKELSQDEDEDEDEDVNKVISALITLVN